MPRDRFADLASLPTVAGPPVGLEPEDDDLEPVPDEGVFMETFFTQVKVIRDKTRQINELLPDVERKHEAVLLAISEQATRDAKAEVDRIMSNISAGANEVRQLLKRMDTQNKAAKSADSDVGSADLRIRESQQNTLTKKFVAVMTTYNDIQARSKRKYRDQIHRQCKVVDQNVDEATVDHLIETGQTAEIFKGKRLAEAQAELDKIKDRHDDILRLERSLMELHEMFMDMSLLVAEQGDMIDRIETSVGKASDYVARARQKLDRALELQTRARHKKICCFIMLACLVALVLGTTIGNFRDND